MQTHNTMLLNKIIIGICKIYFVKYYNYSRVLYFEYLARFSISSFKPPHFHFKFNINTQ